MCGIAGIFNYATGEPVSAERLTMMTRLLAHRGPDGDGHWIDGAIGLGHRRLAIIDLTGGAQPMTNEDGTIQVVFNGEFYNYAAFIAGLRDRGHTFRTRSDTEVFIHLYEDRGPGAVEPLRGMFALAVWESGPRRLRLFRDRLGVKPLYYADLGGRLIFASEVKALLAHPELSREIDPAALQGYLTYGFVPGPHALLRDVHQVPPGHYLEVTAGGAPRLLRWWDFSADDDPLASGSDSGRTPAGSADPAHREAELEAILAESVRLRMVSDVPVGAFLSGGIDSSLVVAMMARQSDHPVRTFSIGFDFAGFDERPYARMVAKRYGTRHEEFVVSADLEELLPRLVWHFDDPMADVSAIPTLRVSEIAARQVTVALSGDGGDEGFGGYTRYANALKDAYADRLPQAARTLLRGVAAALPDTARGKNRLRWLSHTGDARYADFFAGTPPHVVQRHLAAPFRASLPGRGAAAEIAAVFAACPFKDPLARMQYFDARLYLPGDILPKVDRAAMAFQLEAREPLLDHMVLNHGMNLPPEWRIGGGETKRLLRRIARKYLPVEAIDRPKQGFSVPMDRWMRTDLRKLVTETLGDDRTRRRGWLDMAGVSRTLAEHQAGQAERGASLWGLLVLELWARTFLDAPLTPPPAPPPREEFLRHLHAGAAGVGAAAPPAGTA